MAKKKQGEQKKRGAKNKWDMLDMDNRLDMVKGWAQQGALMQEIADMLNVSKELVYKWQREKPEFADAIKKGKYDSNGELLNSAFRSATGYYITEIKKEPISAFELDEYGEPVYDENGRKKEITKMVITEEKTKWVKPDTQMAMFLMKNRMPEYYRERIEHEMTGEAQVMFVDDIPDVPLVEGGEHDGDSEETTAEEQTGDKD